jgi:hypothetical protein
VWLDYTTTSWRSEHLNDQNAQSGGNADALSVRRDEISSESTGNFCHWRPSPPAGGHGFFFFAEEIQNSVASFAAAPGMQSLDECDRAMVSQLREQVEYLQGKYNGIAPSSVDMLLRAELHPVVLAEKESKIRSLEEQLAQFSSHVREFS